MAGLVMVGAMIGDIAGSEYEWANIKHMPGELITARSRFTDDTVLTYAVAAGMMEALGKVVRPGLCSDPAAQALVRDAVAAGLRSFYRRYPQAGYGRAFSAWAQAPDAPPYGSWGNGSAMRVSFAGWAARSLAEARLLARLSAEVTHNHPSGIKGAQVVAAAIFLLRQGCAKEELRSYVADYYDISFTLAEIRPHYTFDVSCEGSVPQAIVAFLEGRDFEEVVKLAISIGGDSDTIAAIAASIAEAHYPVPSALVQRALAKLDNFLRETAVAVSAYLQSRR